MTDGSVVLAEVHRGPFLECVHRGAAVICTPDGGIVAAWGDPSRTILPRSSCKMLQALPLVESGAADRAGLRSEHLALACASHTATPIHTGLVSAWLADLGLGEADLRCGPQPPGDRETHDAMIAKGARPQQIHNNCSGKHSGFLTLTRDLGAGTEYIDPDHPVQRAVRAATEELAGEDSPGHAIDGCAAPNFALTLRGLATAAARFARPLENLGATRGAAAARLVEAMMAHPDLIAGPGRPGTRLTRAAAGRAAVKSGAEGVYLAILPEAGLGIALKIDDGAGRASEAAIAALLARCGILDRAHPEIAAYANAPILNRNRTECGRLRAAETLYT